MSEAKCGKSSPGFRDEAVAHPGHPCCGAYAMPTWSERARSLKRDALALALALRDPRVPWYVKVLGAGIIAYALSPIDLIPDFIPLLGYLDELVLLPLGLLLVGRLIPSDILDEHRAAATAITARPVSRMGAAMVVAAWILAAIALAAALLAWRRSMIR
jgi:uncharacterized membrane protein YkvA (DUF1232 family)